MLLFRLLQPRQFSHSTQFSHEGLGTRDSPVSGVHLLFVDHVTIDDDLPSFAVGLEGMSIVDGDISILTYLETTNAVCEIKDLGGINGDGL